MDCQIDSGRCRRTILAEPRTELTFDISPKPVLPMKRLKFTVTLMSGGSAVENENVVLDLSMPGMYMMANRIPLKHVSGGNYTGEGVIVRCTSGRRVWRADVSVGHNDKGGPSPVASFQFRVAR